MRDPLGQALLREWTRLLLKSNRACASRLNVLDRPEDRDEGTEDFPTIATAFAREAVARSRSPPHLSKVCGGFAVESALPGDSILLVDDLVEARTGEGTSSFGTGDRPARVPGEVYDARFTTKKHSE
jgi:hypothetical protein